MRGTWSLVVAGVLAGCAGAPRVGTVSDVQMAGVMDQTGRAPRDVPRTLMSRVPTMAVEVGLIGRTDQQPGAPIVLRGEITDFPPTVQGTTPGASWIEGGPITIEWTVMEKDGTVLGRKSITTNPCIPDAHNEDPFVWTQARAVVLWLLGR